MSGIEWLPPADLLFEAAALAMAIIGEDERIQAANPRFCQLLGSQQQPGRAWADLLDPADRHCTLAAIGQEQSLRLLRADATPVWVRVSLRRIEQGFLCMAEELAAQSQADVRLPVEANLEQALIEARAANQAKDRFLAIMGHEIRTPLNGVLGMLQLLKLTGLNPEQREMTEVAHRSGEALLALLNDLLDLSKIEAGALELEHQAFGLRQLVDDVLALHALAGQQKQLHMGSRIRPDVPERLRGDAFRLRQILNNLLSNAVKFTEKGEVHVGVELVHASESVSLHFEVVDTGIGFSKEARASIFEPFVQADSSITRKYGGTGLGLAISRKLVNAMGGQLDVQPRPGGGSIFHFTLGFQLAEGVRPQPAPSSTAAPDLARARILVVEDNVVNQLVAVGMLKKLGAEADVAADGEQGLQAIAANSYDLVLMDMMMPVIDGLEATRLLRASESDSHLTVVAMTANASESDREACLEAGMDDFLPKPITLEGMRKMLTRWLGWSEAPAATPAPAPAALYTDPTVLLDLRDFLQDNFSRTLQTFLSDSESLLRALGAACAEQNRELLLRNAHALKGSSSNVGADTLSRLCRGLEARARSIEWPDAELSLQEIHAAFAGVRSELETQWITTT